MTLGPTLQARLASAIYAITSGLLFGISATYHRGTLALAWRRCCAVSTTPTST